MYVIDTNIFIANDNMYYCHDVFPKFWDVFEKLFNDGIIASIDKVYNELSYGRDSDFVKQWAITHPKFFKERDQETSLEYENVCSWLRSNPRYDHERAEKFLMVADAYLIAYAKSKNMTLVTYEKSAKGNSPKIKIPDVCMGLNVKYVDFIGMLREINSSDEYKNKYLI